MDSDSFVSHSEFDVYASACIIKKVYFMQEQISSDCKPDHNAMCTILSFKMSEIQRIQPAQGA